MHNQSVTACVRLGNCHPVSQNPATAHLPTPLRCLCARDTGTKAGAQLLSNPGWGAGWRRCREEDSVGSPSSGLRLSTTDCNPP